MSSSSRPPAPGRQDAPLGYDPLIDPIPRPSVNERDTDTAWAEFDSLMSAELVEEEEEARPDFQETQPFDRDALP